MSNDFADELVLERRAAYKFARHNPRSFMKRIALVVPVLFLTTALHAEAASQPAQGGFEIGQTAPEIEGQDIEGKPMKLSEFRGKVVVINFWGFW